MLDVLFGDLSRLIIYLHLNSPALHPTSVIVWLCHKSELFKASEEFGARF